MKQDPLSPPPQDPRVLDYDLHINLPGQNGDARLAMATGLAVVSALLGRSVPQDMAFIGRYVNSHTHRHGKSCADEARTPF